MGREREQEQINMTQDPAVTNKTKVINMKKDLNNMTMNELKAELELLEKQKENVTTTKVGVWEVGKHYVIRTVTMIDVGKLIAVTDDELVLENASWIADTGRWNEFLKNGTYSESEPFPDGKVIVGRHAIIDAVIWKHGSVRNVK